MLLKLDKVNAYYGNLCAIRNINLVVGESEIVCIIGSNGAGKSTTLKAIMGLVDIRNGTVIINGKKITETKASSRIREGITLSPEGRRLFGNMSVLDNLLVGAYSVGSKAGIKAGLQEVFELFPKVYERRNQLAQSLSGGEQQMVAIGRALMARPKLLMLDEPSLGIAPNIVAEIAESIKGLRQRDGTAVLLVEQNARLALSISDRGYVLEQGEVALEGTGSDLSKNDSVRHAYLGLS